MKRIDKEWWKGADGYYYEVSKGIYEGPYETQQRAPDMDDSTVIDSGSITVFPINNSED